MSCVVQKWNPPRRTHAQVSFLDLATINLPPPPPPPLDCTTRRPVLRSSARRKRTLSPRSRSVSRRNLGCTSHAGSAAGGWAFEGSALNSGYRQAGTLISRNARDTPAAAAAAAGGYYFCPASLMRLLASDAFLPISSSLSRSLFCTGFYVAAPFFIERF